MSLDSKVRAKGFFSLRLHWRGHSLCISADAVTLKRAAFDVDKD